MNHHVDLQIGCRGVSHPPLSDIEQWVAAAIGNRREMTELTVRIVDEAEITQLNHDYRQQNKATNVLSFPADIPAHIDLPLLGDLVICAAVVEREAQQQHKHSQAHWAHMVVHGCLHLLGYDHIDDNDADIMEALEIEILAAFNISNPYLVLSDNDLIDNSKQSQHP
jgi:probable rRNA maturation factor